MPLVLKFVLASMALVLMMFANAATARADIVSIISIPNSALAAQPGPYGTVTLHQLSSTSVQVTLSLNPGFTFFGNGNGNGAFGFNIVGHSTAGLSVSLPAGYTADLTGGNFDGFGFFDVAINDGTPPGSAGPLVFTVSRGSGLTEADLFATNGGSSHHFAVHIFVNNGGPNQGLTGFATDAETPPPSVPEPATIFLLGTGLAGFGAAARKRHRNKSGTDVVT